MGRQQVRRGRRGMRGLRQIWRGGLRGGRQVELGRQLLGERMREQQHGQRQGQEQ